MKQPLKEIYEQWQFHTYGQINEQQDFEDDEPDYGPEESPFNHNLELLNNYFQLSLPVSYFKEDNILDEVELDKQIGSGFFGVVFSIKNSKRTIKFFNDSMELNGELDRLERVEKQLYSGKASLEDMHYFEHGKVGNSGFYYILMPRIIPLKEAPFYRLSDIFGLVADSNSTSFFRVGMTYDNFKEEAIENLLNEYSHEPMEQDIVENELKKYPKTIDKIIKAGYRAYTEFNGTDLHAGNIGYYAQKPDTFFYFDM